MTQADEAIERLRERIASGHDLFGLASDVSALLAEVDRLREALGDATEAIITMSGSSDFAPEGQAGAWWANFRDKRFYPAILPLTTTAALQPQGEK